MKKVNILSMGWRSHWLSRRLNSLGVQVHLYELTSYVNGAEPEDLDGPFPFSITPESPEDFVNFASCEDLAQKLDSGFCMSTPSGNLSWDAQNRNYVLNQFKKVFYSQVKEDQKFWFDDFLKSFGKTIYKKASSWDEEESSFSLESELYFKNSKETTYEESLALLKNRSVEVTSVSKENLDQILNQVKESPEDWVVALTIFELKLLTYNKVESLNSALGWHRKRFFYEGEKLETLPKWSCWLDSPFKPWKEENLNIIIKNKNFLDVWTLEPVYQLGLEEASIEKALSFLRSNFTHVGFKPSLNNSLTGVIKTLFPVVQEEEPMNDKGYTWNSPIEWKGYGMDLMYSYQNGLAQKIYDKGAQL